MSIVIDIVIIAVILLCLYGGYKKGLVGVAFSIISFIVALLIAFILFMPISTYIINNMEFDNNIKTAIVSNFTKDSESTEAEKEENFINEYINDQIDEVKGNTLEIVATQISEICVRGIVFIALFIVAKIVLWFFKAIANFIAELPILKQFNKVGGFIFGLLKGLIITYGLLAILMLVSAFFNETTFYKELDKSYVGGMMYNNNIIIKLLF